MLLGELQITLTGPLPNI